MKIVFFGTSDYCLPVLEMLRSHHNLELVITRPDKPVGRKKVLTPSATKTWASKHNIPVLTPSTLKKDTADRNLVLKELTNRNLDLGVVADYGLIIPESIFNLPKFGTLNIHFSKLPDLRGPSPVQFTLLRGDKEAWITFFKLENPPELKIKMDSGPIVAQKSYPIHPNDTTQTLYIRLFQKAAEELPAVIKSYESHKCHLTVQDHQQATYCRLLTKDDGFVEWILLQQAVQEGLLHKAPIQALPRILQEALATNHSITKFSNFKFQISNLLDFFRAMTPWPGMWTLRQAQGKPKRMIIRKCHLEDGVLVLDEVQFEGKRSEKFSPA